MEEKMQHPQDTNNEKMKKVLAVWRTHYAGVAYHKGLQEGAWKDYPSSQANAFFRAWAENYFKKLRFKIVHTHEKVSNAVNIQQRLIPEQEDDGYDFHVREKPERVWDKVIAFVDDSVLGTHQHEGRFLAAVDSLNPQRAFVGEKVQEGYGGVVGALCSFRKDGKVASIRPFGHVLFPPRSDSRNSEPFWDSVYLCGQTLAFVSYRTCGRGQLQLKGFRMNNKEEIVASFKHIKSLFGGNGGPSSPQHDRPEHQCSQHGRWLCYHSQKYGRIVKEYICLDLKSIRKGDKTEEKNSGMYWDDNDWEDKDTLKTTMLDQVTFQDTGLDPKEVLATLTEVPSYSPSDWDGYPTRCVKCGATTVSATIYFGGCTAGLGRGVCLDCKIRYSKGKKQWLCWNGVKTEVNRSDAIHECFGTVNAPEYICEKTHVDSSNIKIGQRRAIPGQNLNDFTQKEFSVSQSSGSRRRFY